MAASCPKSASRRHLELIFPVVGEALGEAGAGLDDVETVAVTQGPGLVGALLVGLATAKALARGAAAAAARPSTTSTATSPRSTSARAARAALPLPARRAAGTRSSLDVRDHARLPRRSGTSIDDAAGEAFDKGARLLGLGYPGGPAMSTAARWKGTRRHSVPDRARVPRLDFSFAGLKTALLCTVRDLSDEGRKPAARRPRRAPTSTRSSRR